MRMRHLWLSYVRVCMSSESIWWWDCPASDDNVEVKVKVKAE